MSDIVTDHQIFDHASTAARFPLVADTRNARKGLRSPNIFPF